MSDEDLVRARNTRTGDARKIDEWTVHLPGGERARFDVTMRYEHGLCVFGVRSDHPDFLGVRPQDSDLNRLRQELAAEAQFVIDGRLSDGWSPAALLEIRHQLRGRRDSGEDLDFSLTLRLRQVERLDAAPEGNFPVLTVRDPHQQQRVVIRSHADDFRALRPRSGSLTDPEVKAWMASPVSRDEETGLGRIVTEGDGSPERALLAALERFSAALSDRLSPGRVTHEGVPDPSDLIGLMREAVSREPEREEMRP